MKTKSVFLAVGLVFGLLQRHRSELEIICDVLEICLKGANKHKIIYKAELGTSTFNKYLDKLLSSGFLAVRVCFAAGKHSEVKVVDETTKSGVNFLETCVNTLNRLGKVRKTQITLKPMEKWK